MANGATQFDVAFFGLQAGQHSAAADNIAAKLQQASADGGWTIAWMLPTSEGVIMVLERPTPGPTPPKGSLGGYGAGAA